MLKYIDGKTVKEIAVIVGKSPKAIESILQRAKKLLLKSYSKYDTRRGCNVKEDEFFEKAFVILEQDGIPTEEQKGNHA